MQDFLKQDIFFFVTTVAVMLFFLLLGVLLFYLIRIARTVDGITRRLKEGTDIVVDGVAELRRDVKAEGWRIKSLLKFFTGLRNVKKKKS